MALDPRATTLRQTRHQVARGARPDAERMNVMYLIKKVRTLRATYQVRLLTFRAVSEGLTLVLKVPRACTFDPALQLLVRQARAHVRREDL